MAQKQSPVRRAQLVTTTVEVLCPHCGGNLPNSAGEDLWEYGQVLAAESEVECQNCDGRVLVALDPKAQFQVGVG